MVIMNPEYYNALETKCEEKGLTPSDLPLPYSGVPLTAKDYDYKSFYVQKFNEEYQDVTESTANN